MECVVCKKEIVLDEEYLVTTKHKNGLCDTVYTHNSCYDTKGIKRCRVCSELIRGKKNIGLNYCSNKCRKTMQNKIREEQKQFKIDKFPDYINEFTKKIFNEYENKSGEKILIVGNNILDCNDLLEK
jgi:predicted nucleic acid-binding Zn ribbon protein